LGLVIRLKKIFTFKSSVLTKVVRMEERLEGWEMDELPRDRDQWWVFILQALDLWILTQYSQVCTVSTIEPTSNRTQILTQS
jgi:hypothetical protein